MVSVRVEIAVTILRTWVTGALGLVMSSSTTQVTSDLDLIILTFALFYRIRVGAFLNLRFLSFFRDEGTIYLRRLFVFNDEHIDSQASFGLTLYFTYSR